MIRASLLGVAALMALVAAPAEAAFPGRPGPIAYSKTNTVETSEGGLDRSGGLFARGPRLRGGPPARQLTPDPDDHSPSYSADGRQIVFVGENGEGDASIFVMRSDGSGRKEVTTDGLGGANPSFFPGGRAIVFSRLVDGDTHIFTIRLDGSGLRQLTSGPYDDGDPVVSPNGRKIAFVSNRDPDGKRDRSDIFSVRPNGTRLRVLIDGPRSEFEPDWAPSGRRLAFASSRGPGASRVFVARANGAGRVKLLTKCVSIRCHDYVSPVFSPDGRHVAVLELATRTSTITVIPLTGGISRSVDSGGVEEEGFGSHVGAPSWGSLPR